MSGYRWAIIGLMIILGAILSLPVPEQAEVGECTDDQPAGALLIGNWSEDNATHQTRITFFPSHIFTGFTQLKQEDKRWRFTGKWGLVNKDLTLDPENLEPETGYQELHQEFASLDEIIKIGCSELEAKTKSGQVRAFVRL